MKPDAKAQLNLAVMYISGDGVPENNIRGYVWFSVAKTQGNAMAANLINGHSKFRMTAQQIAAAQTLAATCYNSNYQECD